MFDRLGEHPVERPEPGERTRFPGGPVDVPGEQGPFEGGSEVVDVAAEAVEPPELLGAADGDLATFGQVGVVVRVTVPRVIGVEFREDLERVGAERVEEAVAVRTGPGDHRLLHQRGQQLERFREPVTGDCEGGVEVEGAGEHAGSGEEPALLLGEQLEAPVDRRPERLLPFGGVDTAADEQVEAIRQPFPDGRRAEEIGAGGGQLDRERQPIERLADRGDVRGGAVVDVEVRVDGEGTSEEQLHRRMRGDLGGAGGLDGWECEGRYRPRQLPRQPERTPARRQDPHVRRGSQHRRRQLTRGDQHVLARVQDQQTVLGREGVGDRAGRVVTRCEGHPDRRGARGRDEGRVVDRAEVHVPDVRSVAWRRVRWRVGSCRRRRGR